MFGDFLSTIMPEQPKKKKIKLADLKAQKEAKAASEKAPNPKVKTIHENRKKVRGKTKYAQRKMGRGGR